MGASQAPRRKFARRTGISPLRRRTMANNYDVIIIGSGPGGYVAAIRPRSLA
jgi:alkyl hydroperoxide reductase subunit AhpF